MKALDIRSVRTVFDDHFRIDEAEVRYELPDGRMSEPARRMSFERGDSAAAVIVNITSRSVVLVRQFRYPTVAKGPGWLLEVVAGIVELGESPADCIRREMVEEYGYAAEELRPVHTFYTSPGGSSERVHLFYAQVSARSRVGAGGGLRAEQEDIEVVEVPLDRMASLIADIEDAKTLIALHWLIREGWPDDRG